MALNSARTLEMASDIEHTANVVKESLTLILRTLQTNSDLAIDWAAATKPTYIDEDAEGNMVGKNYSRQNVADSIFSLDQVRSTLENLVATQGDHIGNLNKVAAVNPLQQ